MLLGDNRLPSCVSSTSAEAVSDEVAFAILEPYFEAAREEYIRFAKARGLPVKPLKRVCLECRAEMHDTERHFAGASEDGSRIAVAPEMVDLPEDTVAAIFSHEFGHILDFQNPTKFGCDVSDSRLLILDDLGEGEREDRTRVARMRQWERRDAHCVELTADLIAEQVIGVRIGYTGPCMLQSLGRGVPRPVNLR